MNKGNNKEWQGREKTLKNWAKHSETTSTCKGTYTRCSNRCKCHTNATPTAERHKYNLFKLIKGKQYTKNHCLCWPCMVGILGIISAIFFSHLLHSWQVQGACASFRQCLQIKKKLTVIQFILLTMSLMIHLWLLSTFCYLALNFGATCIHIPDAGCWKRNKKCYLPDKSLLIDCVVPENIHTPPTEGFLVWNPHPHPSGNSILVSKKKKKNRAFESLLPLGISVNLPWGRVGMDIF